MRALPSSKSARSGLNHRGARPRRFETLECRELFSAQGLDASFGTAGSVEQTLPTGAAFIQSVAVEPDGKILVGGAVAKEGSYAAGFVLARYNPDGTPDSSFGANGMISTNLANDPLNGGISDILVQSDGKLLVAGGVLARYNADGTLDTSFGTHGVAPGSGGTTWINLQSDGKILTNGTDFTRYNADGTMDTTFGTGGFIIGLGSTRFVVTADDGFVSVAGNALERRTAEGALDDAFGTSGSVTLPLPNGDSFLPTSLLLTADGKIDCVGNLYPSANYSYSPHSIAVFQLNADGSLNRAFGDNGETIITSQEPFTDSSASVLAPDGKLVIVGRSGVVTSFLNTPGDFAGSIFTAELDANGALEPSWGSGGASTIVVGGSSEAGGVAVTPSGQIIIAGDAVPLNGDPGSHALVVVRMDGDFNQSFVQHTYLDLLGRAADPTALAYLTKLLDDGAASPSDVVRLLQSSPEYFSNVVREDYIHFLQRPADPLSLQAWTAYLASGGTRAELAAQILQSDEYYEHVCGGSQTTFLNQVYLDLLDRPIDAASRVAYSDALSSGANRRTIIDYVLSSPEFESALVHSLYLQLLDRPVDASGLSAFISQLSAGAQPDTVIAQIVGSDEYFSGIAGSSMAKVGNAHHT